MNNQPQKTQRVKMFWRDRRTGETGEGQDALHPAMAREICRWHNANFPNIKHWYEEPNEQ